VPIDELDDGSPCGRQLGFKVVVAEADSDKTYVLVDRWANSGNQLIALAFFEMETDSILRQKVVLRRELTPDQADAACAKLQALPIRQISLSGQRQRAWEIATRFGFATVYDASYLALAQLRDCEFWTADERLFTRVKDNLPFVKWLGDYVPQ
jgi:predicted nucleic acid-binding protein